MIPTLIKYPVCVCVKVTCEVTCEHTTIIIYIGVPRGREFIVLECDAEIKAREQHYLLLQSKKNNLG